MKQSIKGWIKKWKDEYINEREYINEKEYINEREYINEGMNK